MAFESFDVAILVENVRFLPLAEPVETLGLDSGPTLDDALRQAQEQAGSLNADTPLDRDARREVMLDLWVRNPTGTGDTTFHLGDGNPILGALIGDSDPRDSEPDAAEGDVLMAKKLMPANIGHAIGGRQYDSTDYYWQEMSSGDYEWALQNFMDDVNAAIAEITSGAANPQEAAALAQLYLNSVGLGEIVHVNNPPPNTSSGGTGGPPPGGEDAPILVTATDFIPPHTNMPTLWMHYDDMEFLDPGSTYDALDVSANQVHVEDGLVLTSAQEDAVRALHTYIARVAALLNGLPANGVFTYADGTTVTVTELRDLWARADFIVTAQTFDNGSQTRRGGGSADRNGGDPIFTVNVNDLIGFMLNDSTGFGYILHELSHVTLAGYAHFTAMHADGTRTDAEFAANETWANSLERAIYEQTGNHFSEGYLPWYNWGTLPTFSVPTQPGGTGGGSGGGSGGGGQVGEN